MGAIKIPRRPIQRVDGLKKEEMDCLNWYVLFGDPIEECYARFVAPQFRDNPRLLKEYSRQFLAGSGVRDYIAAYREEVDVLFRPVREGVRQPSARGENESEEDYNARIERESVAKVKARIASLVDEVEDVDMLLDTIKAMKDTGYFESVVRDTPPMRFLPECCKECRYKIFVDEHVRSGDIEEIDDVDKDDKHLINR